MKKLKAEYLGITGNTVADWMKDLQIDATAMPGKAFDLSFEMPEPDVGIMTFNRCVAVDQWEAMGRPDILEKNCHSTCPKSMIETTKMYNPNMKVDILAIPPRVDAGDVCCKWRFSMRDEDDPEYVPVELTKKPQDWTFCSSLQVELPGHAVAITDPAETGTESVVVERHEHLAAVGEPIEESFELVVVVAVDPE